MIPGLRSFLNEKLQIIFYKKFVKKLMNSLV